jgi:hypothetical protein
MAEMTKQMQVILAVKALVAAALPAVKLAGFDQDDALPTRVDVNGCVVGHPGDPNLTDYDLSPLTWNYSHRLYLEVSGPNGTGGAALDAMLVTLGQAIAADPFLGGLCEFFSAEAAELRDRTNEAANSINWATVPLVAEYSTTNPLG